MPSKTRKSNWKRKVQYLATFSVSIASLTLGLSSGWPTPVIPKLTNNETNIVISKDEVAVMVSMSSPGFMLGSLVCRYVADSLGRRVTILVSAIPITCGTIIIAFAVKPWLMYITRLLWGVGTGMIITAVTMYVAEIAEKEIRGSFFVYTRVMFNLGCLIMFAVGPFVSYKALNYMLLVVPVGYFCACWWIPESPYYCLKEGKVDTARKELMKLRGCKDEEEIEEEFSSMQGNVKREMKAATTAWELFSGRQYRKSLVIVGGLKLFQIMTGTATIQQYLGYIMGESGTNLSLPTVIIVFGAVRFIVGILSSVLVDRVGRRPLIMYSYLGTGICYTIVGSYFLLQEVIKVDHGILNTYGFIPFAGIIASNVISTLGYLSLSYVVPSELFPMNVKAVAMTSNCMFGGCISFFTAIAFQKVKDASGFSGVFGLYALVAFAGFTFVFFVLPETKGLSLEEIQIMLQGESYKCEEAEQLNSVKDVNYKINENSLNLIEMPVKKYEEIREKSEI